MQIVDLKQDAEILWDTGHTMGRLCEGGVRQSKETKTWMRLMCSLYRNEYRNFNLAGATIGCKVGRSEED
jgi:hypothetical protein